MKEPRHLPRRRFPRTHLSLPTHGPIMCTSAVMLWSAVIGKYVRVYLYLSALSSAHAYTYSPFLDPRWVLVSATFDHASWPHTTNNLIHWCCFAPALERVIGPLGLALSYIVAGAAGWLATYASLKAKHGDSDTWNFALKFQTGVGSSPATYGLTAMLAMMACEKRC